jgi:hypothetical protein
MQENSIGPQTSRYRLFDSYGLPWTSRLSWYWLYTLTIFTGFVFAFLLGIYLGLWLKSKGKGISVLLLSLVMAALFILLFFLPYQAHHAEDFAFNLILILWFAAAYLSRQKVISYYSEREGSPFKINPVLAGILSVWYVSGCLRADFPLDESGKTSTGTLKLTI